MYGPKFQLKIFILRKLMYKIFTRQWSIFSYKVSFSCLIYIYLFVLLLKIAFNNKTNKYIYVRQLKEIYKLENQFCQNIIRRIFYNYIALLTVCITKWTETMYYKEMPSLQTLYMCLRGSFSGSFEYIHSCILHIFALTSLKTYNMRYCIVMHTIHNCMDIWMHAIHSYNVYNKVLFVAWEELHTGESLIVRPTMISTKRSNELMSHLPI